MLAFLPAAWATAIVQVHQGGRVPDFYNAVPEVAAAVVAVAAIAAGLFALTRKQAFVAPALVVCAGALLATPAAWSSYEARNASMNTTLPQAGPRQGAAGRSFGSEAFDGGVASLASFLASNGDASARWDLATTSAQQASTLVADYNISVMAVGGFSGNDPTITVDEFADYVADGEVRYVLANEGGANRGGFLPGGQSRGGNVPGGSFSRGGQFPGAQSPGQPASQTQPAAVKGANVVMQAVRAECSPVSGEAVGQYAGNLYDCAGAADRLHAYN